MQIFTTKHIYYDNHIGLEESSLKISEEQKIKNDKSENVGKGVTYV